MDSEIEICSLNVCCKLNVLNMIYIILLLFFGNILGLVSRYCINYEYIPDQLYCLDDNQVMICIDDCDLGCEKDGYCETPRSDVCRYEVCTYKIKSYHYINDSMKCQSNCPPYVACINKHENVGPGNLYKAFTHTGRICEKIARMLSLILILGGLLYCILAMIQPV